MDKLTTPVLVGLQTINDTDVAAASLTALRVARQITSGAVIAVAMDGQNLAEVCAQNGVEVLVMPEESIGGHFSAQDFAELVVKAAQEHGGQDEVGAIIVSSNVWGKEVAGHVAASLGSAAVTDVTEIEVKEGHIEAGKPALGGTWSTRFALTASCPVLAVTSNAASADANTAAAGDASSAASGNCQLKKIAFTPARKVKVLNRQQQNEDEGVALADAQVAVIAGRGIDGDTESVQKIADLLDGAVGATRVACDEEWLDRSVQVGQTGLTISPKIYLGLGVSGAIHHVCGIFGSQNIIAVCDDPDAPIFDVADFGIVGDVSEIMPKLIEILEEKQG